MTKIGDLRKDEPDPMGRLSAGAKLSEDCAVDALLRVEEAVEVVFISHVAVAKVVSGSAHFPKF